MRQLRFAARCYLMGLATFVVFSTLTDWLVAGRTSFAMAWALWNIPAMRVTTLASALVLFLSYSLTGERGGWDPAHRQPLKGQSGRDSGHAGNDSDI
jgi:hypothetical protein